MDTSTNNVSIEDDSEMAECDGEPVVTMMDVLKEQQEFEDDANAVLGASDDKNCTYSKGYVKRQAVYACLTCCSDAKFDTTKRAGVCLACSLNCHENHELLELYTKRSFRCDCGNPKFNGHPCQFTPNKNDLNVDNKYDQNFSGLYCTCHRPYPDPDCSVEDEMIQCIVCEDWLHASHLDAVVPSNDQYSEMICKTCMDKNDFLHDYACYAVNLNSENEELNVDVTETLNPENYNSDLCNGSLKNSETIKDIESTTQGTENNNQDESKSEPEISNKPSETTESVDKMDVDSMENATENLDGSNNIEKTTLETNEGNPEKINFPPEVDKEPLSESEKKTAEEKLSEETKTDTTEESIKNHDDSQMNSNNETNNCTLETVLNEKEDTLKKSTQDTLSEKNDESNINPEDKSINKEMKSDETSLNEEIMSEIDKILGSPYDEKSNATAIETDINECKSSKTNDAGTEQPKSCTTGDASDIENETGTQNTEKEENAGAEPVDDQTLVNKEIALKEDDTSSQNKPGDDKIEVDSMDTEILTNQNENLENSQCIEENAVPESLLNDSALAKESSSNNDKSIIEKSVDTTETEKTEDIKDLNDTSSITHIASSNETEAHSKIDKENINENDVDMNTSTDKNYDIKHSNVTINSDNNVDSERNNSDASADLQTSGISSDIVTPVISEINSVNENNDSFEQNATLNESKRKMTIDDTDTQSCNKKLKRNNEEKTCQRPKGVKRIFKGATFWPTDFRQKLCTCNECLTMYRELSVLFLIDPEDTVTVYEALGHANTDGTPSQYEKGLQALSSLDRIQQINALTEYNKMRDKLLDFLKSFKDKKEIVKEEDIKAFFAGMKPRKEADGVYFCQ